MSLYRPELESDSATLPRRLSSIERSRLVDEAIDRYFQQHKSGDPVSIAAYCRQFPGISHTLENTLREYGKLEQAARDLESSWPNEGDVLGSFQLVRELGRGAFARVYAAKDLALGGRPVALKVTKRLADEATLLGTLDNLPNVIPVHSVSSDADRRWSLICMGYRGDATLEQLIDALEVGCRPDGRLIGQIAAGEGRPAKVYASYLQSVLALGAAIAGALANVHGRRICHLDLKPSNILLGFDGEPYLIDFNLSKVTDASSRLAGGTPAYMAFEQLQYGLGAETEVGPPADQFAVGVVLFQLLTGRHPWQVDENLDFQSELSALAKSQQRGWEYTADDGAAIPAAVRTVLERCVALNPADRWTAAELQEQLRRLAFPPEAPARRRKQWVTATAIACLTLVALWVGLYDKSSTQPPPIGSGIKEGAKARAVVLFRQKLWEPFEDEARLADPELKDAALLAGRGYVELRRRDGDQAERRVRAHRYLEEAVRRGRTDAATLNNLAVACLRVGVSRDKRWEYLSRAVSADGDNIVYRCNRVWACHTDVHTKSMPYFNACRADIDMVRKTPGLPGNQYFIAAEVLIAAYKQNLIDSLDQAQELINLAAHAGYGSRGIGNTPQFAGLKLDWPPTRTLALEDRIDTVAWPVVIPSIAD